MCSTISHECPLEVMLELFFYRGHEKMEKTLPEKDLTKEELQGEWTLPAPKPFIKSLFPENLQADKKGRPTTAGSKIKVGSILE
ncbi:hypothetical protein A6R68_16454, partial [Neotoma lepida]